MIRIVVPQNPLHPAETEENLLLCVSLSENVSEGNEVTPSYSPLYVERGGVVSSHLPGWPDTIMQVKSTGLPVVAALVGEVVPAAGQRSQEAVEAACGGETGGPAEAQVPLAHHVCGVSGLGQSLRQRGSVGWQAERLA